VPASTHLVNLVNLVSTCCVHCLLVTSTLPFKPELHLCSTITTLLLLLLLLLVFRAGIFRASQLRVNPRQRAAHALFKTYLDVLHVAKDEGDRLFRPRGAAGTEVSSAAWFQKMHSHTEQQLKHTT
jgi:hypothetical protein